MDGSIILYPSPGRGHLASMVELAKHILGHHPSFSVTVLLLSTPPPDTHFVAAVSATHPSITFHHVPAVSLPNSDDLSSSPANFILSTFEIVRLHNPTLQETLVSLSKSSAIKAFIIDFFCNAAFGVSASLNIPTYYYFTSGASGLASFLYVPALHKKYPDSFKDLNESIIMPGFPPVSPRDMPMAISNRSLKVYSCFFDTAVQMAKSAGLIINTFDSFEPSALKALRDGLCVPDGATPPTYCVGPLVAAGGGTKGGEERHECLGWLDLQPSRSVLFLSFGSMGVFSARQLKEIAIGLERSEVRFLWVVRVPPPHDEARHGSAEVEPGVEPFLPEGFVDRTRGRGKIVESWAPQVEVLGHGSVGGFVTHCGWNSVLEAVCGGLPMLAWPLYAEQRLNRAYLVEEMKLALSVTESEEDGLVSADELEERVNELMRSEKGRAIKDRVLPMRDAATAALSEGGSSLSTLAELIGSIKAGSSEVDVPDLVTSSTGIGGGLGSASAVKIST
ncbi:UDP-glycosyltransferase 88B1-like [Rhodamnia argentea]|uniref:Glycosyltransferase n=1 Tax=Rhodamnia argentea TaxID=178133 RepID=A0A8B8PF97_9MYRT|nr:UDP-glycosyltransferase 88B1-like [Rhodamnia argentea]